ncbi:hypothetical protein pclt_cds_376 [Pandoravirus celtis]|uniref:Uncharacterized protein n=1 Tax=Pandoravirus celtis TaxID=2568002 RepID=A0A4D6EGS5_9VIRU|nr:hypothetical protein pclt_cds_376 [Pandoravirus celtis]
MASTPIVQLMWAPLARMCRALCAGPLPRWPAMPPPWRRHGRRDALTPLPANKSSRRRQYTPSFSLYCKTANMRRIVFFAHMGRQRKKRMSPNGDRFFFPKMYFASLFRPALPFGPPAWMACHNVQRKKKRRQAYGMHLKKKDRPH